MIQTFIKAVEKTAISKKGNQYNYLELSIGDYILNDRILITKDLRYILESKQKEQQQNNK